MVWLRLRCDECGQIVERMVEKKPARRDMPVPGQTCTKCGRSAMFVMAAKRKARANWLKRALVEAGLDSY
jgi:ribosomal protein L44E